MRLVVILVIALVVLAVLGVLTNNYFGILEEFGLNRVNISGASP